MNLVFCFVIEMNYFLRKYILKYNRMDSTIRRTKVLWRYTFSLRLMYVIRSIIEVFFKIQIVSENRLLFPKNFKTIALFTLNFRKLDPNRYFPEIFKFQISSKSFNKAVYLEIYFGTISHFRTKSKTFF